MHRQVSLFIFSIVRLQLILQPGATCFLFFLFQQNKPYEVANELHLAKPSGLTTISIEVTSILYWTWKHIPFFWKSHFSWVSQYDYFLYLLYFSELHFLVSFSIFIFLQNPLGLTSTVVPFSVFMFFMWALSQYPMFNYLLNMVIPKSLLPTWNFHQFSH